jgi:hypothetical protein
MSSASGGVGADDDRELLAVAQWNVRDLAGEPLPSTYPAMGGAGAHY